jgi:hypothetical protein
MQAGRLTDDVGDSREERAFRMWINSLGIEVSTPAVSARRSRDVRAAAPARPQGLYVHSLFLDSRCARERRCPCRCC